MSNEKLKKIIEKYPISINFFKLNNIDYSNMRNTGLNDAIQKSGLPVNETIKKLETYIDGFYNPNRFPQGLEDFDIPEMIDHILEVHHGFTNRILKDLSSIIPELQEESNLSHAEIMDEIASIFVDIKAEIQIHFAEEEVDIFPAIRLSAVTGVYSKRILEAIRQSEEVHSIVGEYITKLIELTDDFNLVDKNSELFNLMMIEFRELVKDLFLHIYKENTFLFEVYEEKYYT